jgi:hypothetical protein
MTSTKDRSLGCDSRSKTMLRIGIVRHLPANEPQSMYHPMHDEKWLALAEALGRAAANRDFNLLQLRKKRDNDEAQERGSVRAIFE